MLIKKKVSNIKHEESSLSRRKIVVNSNKEKGILNE
jgi:hypothetical protein